MDFNNSHDAKTGSSLLLLEDDEALRQMLEWELSELGYRVTSVGRCHEARSAAVVRDFNLALLDIGLPDGDGAELAAELIEQSPKIGIVLCTGRPGNLIAERFPAKVLARLTKPVSIGQLDALFRSRARP